MSKDYKVVIVPNKTGFFSANHRDKQLLVSKDVVLKRTDDGKLHATFPNFRPKKHPFKFRIFGMSAPSFKSSDTDCSLIVSDLASFNHCIQKDGAYHLSGSDVTFNGTYSNDVLFLDGTNNSRINMSGGNDTVFYHGRTCANNDVDLGGGNNIFSPIYKTDSDLVLKNNRITSGGGQDVVHLRQSSNNEINTGGGNDLVAVDGDLPTGTPSVFENNLINTESGHDVVNVWGKFNRFKNNTFYLGKGSDKFRASINPNDDVNTALDYGNNLGKYVSTVSKNKIFATDCDKGMFEKNIFESKTYSANQLWGGINMSSYSEGFQNFSIKPVPESSVRIPKENKVVEYPKKLTDEELRKKYTTAYQVSSLGAMLFNDPKMQEQAIGAVHKLVNSWQ